MNYDESILSQLADGELDADESCKVLLGVLDDDAARAALKRHLHLRDSFAAWRRQTPARPIESPRPNSRPRPQTHDPRRMLSLLPIVLTYGAAAALGGLLVLGGMMLAGRNSERAKQPTIAVAEAETSQRALSTDEKDSQTREAVEGVKSEAEGGHGVAFSPDQMREVAQVFAFHESVAGPLHWYADDEQNIQLCPSDDEVTGRPIAVVLHLSSGDGQRLSQNILIVCRERVPADLRLPKIADVDLPLQLHLLPNKVDGRVDLQYALALRTDTRADPVASLAGWRTVGETESSLGKISIGERSLDIGASAWEVKPL